MRSSKRRVAALAVVLAVAGVGAAHAVHVTVGTQAVDGKVVVDSVTVQEGDFLVVHRDDGGKPGAAIGHAAVSRGFHDDAVVPVRKSVSSEATKLWVVVHEDDGDGTFEAGTDEPIETVGGVAGARFSARGGDPVFLLTPDSRTQHSNGSVRVSAVASDREAFLVVYTNDRGRLGQRVGHRSVSRGVSCNVSVGLDDAAYPEDRKFFSLWAVLYADDGDGEFEPDADEPVRIGNSSVRTQLEVTTTAPPGGSSPPTDSSCPDRLVGSPGDGTAGTETGTASDGGDSGPLPAPGLGITAAVVALLAVLVAGVLRRR